MPTRRALLLGAGAASLLGMSGTAEARARDALRDIARASGGRLGVFAYDTGTGRRLSLDAGARYALCSTFKAPLAAAILAQVDAGRLTLDRTIRFGEADLLGYAPVVRENLATGALSVERLCRAAVEVSDNSAANLLLPQLGGPAGLTRWLRSIGDPATRLDRDEPTLNIVRGGDLRDTTTPMAIAMTIDRLLFGDVLMPQSHALLQRWMAASTTGRARLRGGLPADWQCGDKTGTSGEGCFNDVAFAIPPGRKPIVIACYLDAAGLSDANANAAHAAVGELVGQVFA
ncbi:class A beta-lactamase [Sphingomonas japonica]|uniref:Beta-lactamase n=1 Tax=Sphingomonas japonica TaxID=511662 RepID=A0ABX0U5Q7_9SPHN|nr:class A beta-lactamase [Sphingomonas japonica]NIJ25011.1 beta-lactamase class A [Sphingomonas japonica]